MLAMAIAGATLMGNTSMALSAYPHDELTTVENPLYKFDTNSYDEDSLNALAAAILGEGNDIKKLVDYITREALTSGKPVGKEITLRYGRYRNTSSINESYMDLIWMPVYMSTTKDGQNAVLTLYLSTANGPVSQYEKAEFSYLGEYTSDPGKPPSNMYGTSFIRSSAAGGLGNGGTYTYYYNNTNYTGEGGIPTDETHKYINFLQYSYTDPDDGEIMSSRGVLYDDIVTPS